MKYSCDTDYANTNEQNMDVPSTRGPRALRIKYNTLTINI